ncbi:hypothetical protein CHS0354_034784 [Potamilus streckersoni]|uniref:Uncharacterized protein n=1 Tax=Potamilus streckersoni TaxID=2493646 RepID=A0AAE0RSX5_9BIVA|nr:hypothetical protein CHS0354_034784 [Potamilus streckersoni]
MEDYPLVTWICVAGWDSTDISDGSKTVSEIIGDNLCQYDFFRILPVEDPDVKNPLNAEYLDIPIVKIYITDFDSLKIIC